MIASAPGCPTAIHHAMWWLLSHGYSTGFEWSDQSAASAALFPSVILGIVAIWAHMRSHSIVLGSIVAIAGLVHPPLVALFALLLASNARSALTGTERLIPVVAIVAGVALSWTSPRCDALSNSLMESARDAISVTAGGIGLIAILLAVSAAIDQPRARLLRAAGLLLVGGVIASIAFRWFDVHATMAPAIVAVWWVAARRAAAVISGAASTWARAGTAVVLAAALLVHPVRAVEAARTRSSLSIAYEALAPHLDTLTGSGTIASDGARHDWLVRLWRASGRARHAGIDVADRDELLHRAGDRAIYAFPNAARELALLGFRLAPRGPAPTPSQAALWIALNHVPCRTITTTWQDLSLAAADGQIVVRFAAGGAPRMVQIYAAIVKTTKPMPVHWPGGDVTGFEAKSIDFSNAAERDAVRAFAKEEGADLTDMLRDTVAMARVSVAAPAFGATTRVVSFRGPVAHLIARIDAPLDSVQLCRSTLGEAVLGDSPPDTIPIADESAAHLGAETVVSFFATRPLPLALRVEADKMPSTVDVNGVPARCEGSSGGCQWLLPTEAIQPGRNTLTIRPASVGRLSLVRR